MIGWIQCFVYNLGTARFAGIGEGMQEHLKEIKVYDSFVKGDKKRGNLDQYSRMHDVRENNGGKIIIKIHQGLLYLISRNGVGGGAICDVISARAHHWVLL